MARRRIIDPSIWDDEAVGSLSLGAFKLFIYLISNADDEGRLEVTPRSCRGGCYRFSNITVATARGYLAELGALRSITLYEADGRSYAQLNNWKRYQWIQKPRTSTIPPPPSDCGRTVPVQYESDTPDMNRIEGNRTEGSTPPNPPDLQELIDAVGEVWPLAIGGSGLASLKRMVKEHGVKTVWYALRQVPTTMHSPDAGLKYMWSVCQNPNTKAALAGGNHAHSHGQSGSRRDGRAVPTSRGKPDLSEYVEYCEAQERAALGDT